MSRRGGGGGEGSDFPTPSDFYSGFSFFSTVVLVLEASSVKQHTIFPSPSESTFPCCRLDSPLPLISRFPPHVPPLEAIAC